MSFCRKKILKNLKNAGNCLNISLLCPLKPFFVHRKQLLFLYG